MAPIVVAAVAATAHAAGVAPSNSYTATTVFSPSKLGSQSKPVPVSIFVNYEDIHIFNAGQGQLAFTLDGPGSLCLGLGTGAVAAFPGSLSVRNNVLTLDAPIPRFITFPRQGSSVR